MNDRLYPSDFLRTYRNIFGGNPPDDFCEAYELLADSLYFGVGLQIDHVPGKFRGGNISDAFFREPRLLTFKFLVDARLAAACQALRTWQAQGQGPKAIRRAPAPARGGDLAADGGARSAGTNGEDKET